MSKRKRRVKAAKPAAAAKLVKLRPPAGCGPLKRGGRRYVPSPEGIVAAPAALVDDLLAHGFALLGEREPTGLTAGDETTQIRGDDHGG